MADTVQCPDCKKTVKVVRYGDGYVAHCCGKIIYSSKTKPK